MEVARTCTAHACDLHRAVLEVDAEAAGYATTWRALSRDRGQLVALAVLILAVLLMPGCAETKDPYAPLFILALLACLATVATVTVLCLTSIGRRFGVVETRDDVDAEADGVRR